MATKKTTTKSTTKKSTASKSSPKKATVTKATPKKRAVAPKQSAVSTQSEFMAFSPTRETVYWLVLGAVVILFTIWILRLQSDINAVYDQIDSSQIEANALDLETTRESKSEKN